MFDDRSKTENSVHGFVFAFDFANFSSDEKRAVMDDALAGERSAPAMNQFAPQRAGINAPAHAVAEADENAFVQSFILDFAWGSIKALAFGDVEELLE